MALRSQKGSSVDAGGKDVKPSDFFWSDRSGLFLLILTAVLAAQVKDGQEVLIVALTL